MRPWRTALAVCCSVQLVLAASAAPVSAAAKDQERIGPSEPSDNGILTTPLAPLTAPDEPDPEPGTAPAPGEEGQPYLLPEETDGDRLRDIETVELTIDVALRALNALEEVRDKYSDQGVEAYETLEEFVAKTSAGKRLEADIMSFGFSDIRQWNTAISSVGFAYDAVTSSIEQDIRYEIDEARADRSIDAGERARVIRSLEAMLPSENNKAIIRDLLNDPGNRYKLRLLDERE